MCAATDNHDLARQFAVLEERINTKAAETESALDRLRADMAARDTDAAKRATRMLLAIAGMIGLAVAVLGVLISSGG